MSSTKIMPLFPSEIDKINNLKPVTTSSIFDDNNNLHPDGLYSIPIFGDIGSNERSSNISYINLNVKIMEPVMFEAFISLSAVYRKVAESIINVKYDENTGDLVESNDGETGLSYLFKVFHKLKFKETNSVRRVNKIKMLNKYRDKAFITKLLVSQAAIRDITFDEDDRPVEFEVNDYYKQCLNLSKMFNNVKENDLQILDNTYLKLQNSVQQVYEYYINLMDGKHKLIRGSVLKRSVKYGTRNVLSSLKANTETLTSTNIIGINDTTVGVFQYAKAIEPITLVNTRELLDYYMPIDRDEVTLFNMKTNKFEVTSLVKKNHDKWKTTDGLLGLLNSCIDVHFASSPMVINSRTVLPLYKKDNTITVITPMTNMEAIDKEHIIPATYLDLFFLSVFNTAGDHRATVTRYPITGRGSIFPTTIRLSPTINNDEVTINMPNGTEFENILFPNYKHDIFMGINVGRGKLLGLGADHDGDTVSFIVTATETSKKEIDELLNKLTYYVDENGEPVDDFNDDIISNVLHTLNLKKKNK